MKLSVHVKTGKRATKVTKTGDSQYTIEVTARPEKGKANEAVIRALAKHLNLAVPVRSLVRRRAPTRLLIVSGVTSSNKMIETNAV